MDKRFLRDAFGWGFILWLIGYLLGILLFFVVPPDMIGYVITPVGTLIALWVLTKKVRGSSFRYYLDLALVWTLIAVAGDYIFLVLLFHPAGGYYKLDVYLYYAITLTLPLIVAARKFSKR